MKMCKLILFWEQNVCGNCHHERRLRVPQSEIQIFISTIELLSWPEFRAGGQNFWIVTRKEEEEILLSISETHIGNDLTTDLAFYVPTTPESFHHTLAHVSLWQKKTENQNNFCETRRPRFHIDFNTIIIDKLWNFNWTAAREQKEEGKMVQ